MSAAVRERLRDEDISERTAADMMRYLEYACRS
jgi:hypothetical protein